MRGGRGGRIAEGLAVLLLLACTAAIYLHDLDRVPVYLGLDEAHFAVQAQAIARTGRTLGGDLLPLFVGLVDPLGEPLDLPWGTTWYQPLAFYLIALALKVAPLTETTIRAPIALIGGVVNILLMYLVARQILGPWHAEARTDDGIERRRRWQAIAAALMLALTPAHLIISRQAADYVMPLPFVLGWLWCLASWHPNAQSPRVGGSASVRLPSQRLAYAGGLVLGIGCYSYITSWVMMPFYLAISAIVFHRASGRGLRPALAAAAGLATPLLLLIPWLVWRHPEMLGNMAIAYGRADPSYSSATQLFARGVGPLEVLRRSISLYWSYFDPSFLFLIGGGSRAFSTGHVGVFLLPIAVLLPLGVWVLVRRPGRSWVSVVLLAGFLAAPLAATLKGSPFEIQRITTLMPFAILVSACGFAMLWDSGRLARTIAILLLAAVPIQFAAFYRDYFTGYRLASAATHDRTAFAEAAPYLIESESRVSWFYLTTPMYDVSAKWRFFVTKYGREDLLNRTRYFNGDAGALAQAEPGSLVVVPNGPTLQGFGDTREWSLERTVTDIAGEPTLAILRRVR